MSEKKRKLSDDEAAPADSEEVIASVDLKGKIVSARDCPYMDTIARKNIDFDETRECSVTGSVQNIYSCLVCGKYFQGRGPHTPAYIHSVDADHKIFINLKTEKVCEIVRILTVC